MFQKKIVEPEPIELTVKEIKTIKDKLSEEENSDLKIRDLKMDEIIPQSFKGVVVDIQEGKHVLYLPDNMDGAKYKTFRKSKGGMFSRDVLAYKRGNEHGKYILIEGKDERKIVRLIEDEELFLFKTFKLVNGIIKDKPYMLIRELNSDGKLTSNGRYIEKNSEHEEPDEVMAIEPQVIVVEDDHETNVTSVSLFDE